MNSIRALAALGGLIALGGAAWALIIGGAYLVSWLVRSLA